MVWLMDGAAEEEGNEGHCRQPATCTYRRELVYPPWPWQKLSDISTDIKSSKQGTGSLELQPPTRIRMGQYSLMSIYIPESESY